MEKESRIKVNVIEHYYDEVDFLKQRPLFSIESDMKTNDLNYLLRQITEICTSDFEDTELSFPKEDEKIKPDPEWAMDHEFDSPEDEKRYNEANKSKL